MRFIATGILLFFSGSQAYAMTDTEREQFLSDMTDIVLAEKLCNFHYDAQAISDYIATRVPVNDTAFAGDLRFRIRISRNGLEDMAEESARVMYCTQQMKTAISFGFIKVQEGQTSAPLSIKSQ